MYIGLTIGYLKGKHHTIEGDRDDLLNRIKIIHIKSMNIEDQYINLMKEILKSGTAKSDRTGTGTLSIFGKQLRHKMSCGFPLLTTKKVPLKTVATELIWMLMGRTDLRWLLQHNCRIWTGDAYKKYANYASNLDEPDWDLHIDDPHENCTRIMSKSEFEEMILSNDIFSEQWGDLGFIYGKQWRYWSGTKTAVKINIKASPVKWNYIGGIDQIVNLITELKANPDCRRLIVNAWNAKELDQMTLPPCHYGF